MGCPLQGAALVFPYLASALPGLPWPKAAHYYPTKDEAAAYLQQYAAHFQLPIVHNQRVVHVQLMPSSSYQVHTATGTCYQAQRVIVCTGPYSAPARPSFADDLPPTVQQLHSSGYHQPADLRGHGPVAVVGSGNSALQIAADVAETGRPVYVAFDEHTPAMPNNTAMWVFLTATGFMRVPGHTVLGRHLRNSPEPVVSQDLHRLQQFPHAHFIGRGQSATAAGELLGVHHTTPPLDAVVWATGFRPAFNWLQIPGSMNERGEPYHFRGLSPVKGLAFLGLPWLHNRRSALMGGAGPDARHVVKELLKST